MLLLHIQLQLPALRAVLLLPGEAPQAPPPPPDPLEEAAADAGTEQHQARHQQERPRQTGGL